MGGCLTLLPIRHMQDFIAQCTRDANRFKELDRLVQRHVQPLAYSFFIVFAMACHSRPLWQQVVGGFMAIQVSHGIPTPYRVLADTNARLAKSAPGHLPECMEMKRLLDGRAKAWY